MAEIAAIDVLRGDMKVRDGRGHSSGHPCADDQGDEFDDRKEDCDSNQDVGDSADKFSERSKEMAVKHSRTSCDKECRADIGAFAIWPIDDGQGRSEGDLTIEAAAGIRDLANSENGVPCSVLVLLASRLIVRGHDEAAFGLLLQGSSTGSGGWSGRRIRFTADSRGRERDLAEPNRDFPNEILVEWFAGYYCQLVGAYLQ